MTPDLKLAIFGGAMAATCYVLNISIKRINNFADHSVKFASFIGLVVGVTLCLIGLGMWALAA